MSDRLKCLLVWRCRSIAFQQAHGQEASDYSTDVTSCLVAFRGQTAAWLNNLDNVDHCGLEPQPAIHVGGYLCLGSPLGRYFFLGCCQAEVVSRSDLNRGHPRATLLASKKLLD